MESSQNMRVETNERLIKRNRQIAQYLFFATFAILIGGLFVINTQVSATDSDITLIALAQGLLLPVAFIATLISVRMTNLWVRQPRPEVVIRDSLKGLSNRSVLYNYFHIPARHVLICPQGVFVIVTRYHDGRYTVENDKWRTLRSPIARIASLIQFNALGDPTYDAHRAVAHLKKLLEPIAPNVEVKPLIVFTDPRANIEVVSSTIPVIHTEQKTGKKTLPLKDVIKDYGTKAADPLTPEQIVQFEAATLPAK